MMSNISLKEAAEFFKSQDGFVIFTHANPDGDTLGSAAALVRVLRKMGKKALALCADPVPQKLKFMDTDDVFTDKVPEKAETFVSVDVASIAVLGKLSFFCEDSSFDLSIDHHRVNSLPCKRLLVRDNYIANGEIIYELALELGAEIDSDIATALYTAICSDSGGFKYANTRPETYECAAEMIRKGADFVLINKLLFEQKTTTQISLERVAYNTLSLYKDGKVAIVSIDEETAEKLGVSDSDYDVLNQIPRQIYGVEVSAVLRPREGGTKVSLRSNDFFDVSEFAKLYGGGGHIHAAGYRFAGCVGEATADLIKNLDGAF